MHSSNERCRVVPFKPIRVPHRGTQVERFRLQGRKVVAFQVSYPSAVKAFVMFIVHVANALVSGVGPVVWRAAEAQRGVRPKAASLYYDSRHRVAHDAVSLFFEAIHRLRRTWVEEAVARTTLGESVVWRALRVAWRPVVDLAVQVDLMSRRLQATIDVLDLRIDQVRTLGKQPLPSAPERAEICQEIVQHSTSLNNVEGAPYEQIARHVRDSLATAQKAVLGVARDPYVDALVHARDYATLGLVLLQLELVRALAHLIDGADDIGRVGPRDLVPLLREVRLLAGRISGDTKAMFGLVGLAEQLAKGEVVCRQCEERGEVAELVHVASAVSPFVNSINKRFVEAARIAALQSRS